MSDKLRQLEETLAKATPGPWEVDGRCGPVMGAAILPPYGYSETPVVALDAGVVRQADAALIVAAVNALPDLIAAVRSLLDKAAAVQRVEELLRDGEGWVPEAVDRALLRRALDGTP